MRRIWTRYCVWSRGVRARARERSASAWQCDFLDRAAASSSATPAPRQTSASGRMQDGSPTWGHLEYIDPASAPTPKFAWRRCRGR